MSLELNEKVISDVRQATSEDEGLRERVRALVMQALVERRADPDAVKSVMRAALAGIDGGLARRGVQAGSALREAVAGVDEAVARSVYAVRMALEEAWGQGREFAEGDARETMSTLRDLEDDLLLTLKNSADDAKGWMKTEFTDLAAHFARAGTDTGAQVRSVMERLNSRLATAASGAGGDARTSVRLTRTRLSEVASGILHGLADVLDSRGNHSKADE